MAKVAERAAEKEAAAEAEDVARDEDEERVAEAKEEAKAVVDTAHLHHLAVVEEDTAPAQAPPVVEEEREVEKVDAKECSRK